MNKIIHYLILLTFLISTVNLFSQWERQSSGTDKTLYSVHFVSNSTGYVCGQDGVILKSTNGGISWIVLNSGVNVTLNAIRFVNARTGFAAGDHATLLKTVDGGLNWTPYTLEKDSTMRSLYFINSRTGWATGDAIILKTTNRGNSWTEQFSTHPKKFYSVYFRNNNTGWITGYVTLKTTNGGINWITKDKMTNRRSIFFVDLMTGWSCGGSYSFCKNTNGGEVWDDDTLGNSIDSPPGINTCLNFINSNTGWLTTFHSFGGTIRMTTNKGTSWVIDQSQVRNVGFFGVYARDFSHAWAVGENGAIYTRSALTVINHNEEIPLQYNLSQNYPNPFNPSTEITFEIPEKADIKLSVFDITGREVSVLANGNYDAGKYSVKWNAENYASGVYLYRITAGDYTASRTMVLIK